MPSDAAGSAECVEGVLLLKDEEEEGLSVDSDFMDDEPHVLILPCNGSPQPS